MTDIDLQRSYDAIPYRSAALPNTHPTHLFAVATLLGMRPAPPDRCRVLELGCADGGNLLAMAYTLPGSAFVGIDLSERQIDAARRQQQALGIANVTLEARDILDIPASFGAFDYIIAYGIYSWVPPEVQEHLLEVCRRHLAPQGVALISYNTYPGWHLRGMVRDMLVYHTRQFGEMQQRVDQSRALLDFLVDATDTLGKHMPRLELYHRLLRQEHDVLRERPDYYLAHEHLDGYSAPVYLSEFVERAARHELQYLVDAHLSSSLTATMPRPIAERLDAIAPNQVALEQYLDFLTNRQFRETLLCRSDTPVDRQLSAARLAGLHLASPARREASEDGVGRYRAPGGTLITLRAPSARAAIEQLIDAWPQSIPFAELVARAHAASGSTATPEETQRLAETLLHCHMYDIVALRGVAAPLTATPGAKPRASAIARREAADDASVASLIHSNETPDAACRCLLPLLDGNRDRAELAALLADGIARHAFIPDATDTPLEPAALLERYLERLARAALLES
jgi:SAM-dependent methyltransferase